MKIKKMENLPVVIWRNDVSWVTWQLYCAKFDVDAFKTKELILYVSEIAIEQGDEI